MLAFRQHVSFCLASLYAWDTIIIWPLPYLGALGRVGCWFRLLHPFRTVSHSPCASPQMSSESHALFKGGLFLKVRTIVCALSILEKGNALWRVGRLGLSSIIPRELQPFLLIREWRQNWVFFRLYFLEGQPHIIERLGPFIFVRVVTTTWRWSDHKGWLGLATKLDLEVLRIDLCLSSSFHQFGDDGKASKQKQSTISIIDRTHNSHCTHLFLNFQKHTNIH